MNPQLCDIVKRSIKGDQRAFKQLYDLYAPSMLGVCIRYTTSRQEAQEVLANGFVRVFEKLHTLKNYDSIGSWIYHIMVRSALNYLHKQSIDLDYINIEKMQEYPAEDYDQYDVEYLLLAIQHLPSQLRIVFNMHEVEGYSHAEIAKELNISEENVRISLYRARKTLKETINQYE